MESRFVVNYHLALHGGEKIGNIMIHVSSINDTFGCIKTDETYVIEGEVYGENPPYMTYRANLSGDAFAYLQGAWRFAKTVKKLYGRSEETEMLYRAFFTIFAITDASQRKRLNDGPWVKDVVKAHEYVSLEFDNFLWVNARRVGVSKHDLGVLQNNNNVILSVSTTQAIAAVVELLEEMLQDPTEHHRSLVDQSIKEMDDIRWWLPRDLRQKLDAIEAALGERAHTPYRPSLGISLEFYQVG